MPEVTKYDYTGDVQAVTLSSGRYKLEAFGAGGGSDATKLGGKGGYACGELLLDTSKTIFICVGGAGSEGAGANGGYNGGGKSGEIGSSGAGGGATHIAINRNRGVLSKYESYKDDILLVAGGGGGGGYSGQQTGHGGGLQGGPNDIGQVATQTEGFAFGQGEDKYAPGRPIDSVLISGEATYPYYQYGYVRLASFTVIADGELELWTESNLNDSPSPSPHAGIYRNSALYSSCFPNPYDFHDTCKVWAGDNISITLSGYYNYGHCKWYCKYPGRIAPSDGGGGGGGWYGGYCGSADKQGSGGSGYVNTSVLKKTSLVIGGGAANAANGYVIISKYIYKINLVFENCSGTHNYLMTNVNEELIVAYNGDKVIINSVWSQFTRWHMPTSNPHILCTPISDTQYKITLKCNTDDFSQDVTYVIRALYTQCRLNSNFYKNPNNSVFDWLKLIGE